MYLVNLYDNPYGENPTVIHSPTLDGPKVEGFIKKDINLIESFKFSTGVDNPAYTSSRPLQTFIEVENTVTQTKDFAGRILDFTESMTSGGEFNKTFQCEGELGYFHDSVSRHLEFRGTPKALMETVIDWHNQQTEDYKHFVLGEMNVTNSTDNMYVYLSATRTTFEELQDKFLNRIGGEFQVRNEDGIRYLDYLEKIGQESETDIRLSKNLMTISKKVDPTQIITRLTPLGERIQSEDTDATDASEARLTIESVNNGVSYIDRKDLKDILGIQGKSVSWDDITEPSRLLTTGRKFLNDQKLVLNQYSITALDLSTIGKDVNSFTLGWTYPVLNPVMGIDEYLRVVGLQIDINEPQNSSLIIGDKFKTMREYQEDMNRSARVIKELQGRVDSLSRSNIRLNSSLQDAQTELESIRTSLQDVDLEGLPQELQTISQQLLAIDLLLDNLEIPEYDLVTPSTDGLMGSYDKNKLDMIHTTTIVDLDDILNRLEQLEEPEEPEEPEETGGE